MLVSPHQEEAIMALEDQGSELFTSGVEVSQDLLVSRLCTSSGYSLGLVDAL